MPHKKDIDKELEKYRALIDRNYVENDYDQIEKDILMFCLNKKFNRDKKIYKKERFTFFDDDKISKILNIFKSKRKKK